MKKKVWDITVKDNPNRVVMGENDEFYTTDTEAFLVFNLQDEDFHPQSAMITLENRNDGSLKSEEVEVIDGDIQWEMPERYIEHSGNWQAQLVYEQMKGGVPEKYTSGVMAFTVNSHIKDKKKPSLVEIENWEKFIREGTELIETWEDLEALREENERQRQENYQELLDTGVLQTNINTKLEQLEEEYAPKLNEVTAQLAQKVGGGVKLQPEDFSDDSYALLTGNGTVNVLSEPQKNSVSPEKTTFIKVGKNLFDKTKAVDGVYVSNTTGELQNHVTYTTSEFIPVEKNESYVYSRTLNGEVLTASAFLAFYTKDKTFISGRTISSDPIISPETAYYIRVSFNSIRKDYFQLEKGVTKTLMEPYKILFDDVVGIQKHTHALSDIAGLDELAGVNKVELSLPASYDLVVGDTFELFWKGVILANDPYIYNIRVDCSKGSTYKRKFIYTPQSSDIGTYPMTVSVYDDNETILDTKTIELIVRAKANNPNTKKNVLCIGDSLISDGQWVNETFRRLTSTGGTPVGDGLTNVNFVGTRRTELNAGYEGYGGWIYANYITRTETGNIVWVNVLSHDKNETDQHSIYKDSNNNEWKIETIESTRIKLIRVSGGSLPTSGTLTWVSGGENHADIVYSSITEESGNPFWNDATNQVDFANYVSEQGISHIDICYILLGWNMTYYSESSFKNSARIFIDKFIAEFPNSKIVLMGLQVPSIDGFGVNYGNAWNYYDKLKFVFSLNQWYSDIVSEYENVEFLNVAGQFDTEYNMQTWTRKVNVRNSSTDVYQKNGVHPADSGYMQIADAVYRNVTGKL